MEFIRKNGKDYLVTYVAKIDNHSIDANALFYEIRQTLDMLCKASNQSFISKGYGSPLQSFLNRYSGDYFSPSFMKGYMENPAMSIMQNFFTEQVFDATAIGTTFHKIMEDYYKLPKSERRRSKLYLLEEKNLPAGMNKNTVDEYVNGYYNIKDYLHPRSELDDTTLECVTEHRGRAKLYVKSIGYTLPCALSYVADRVDYREDDVVILDYKTGSPKDISGTFEGYLGSMILYKWAMEQELNTEINKGFLIFPKASTSEKYIKLDYSIENEKILADQIDKFYDKFMKDNRSRVYDFTEKGYFNNTDANNYKAIMTDNTIWMSKIPVYFCIGDSSKAYGNLL